jgi:hypothetical protein
LSLEGRSRSTQRSPREARESRNSAKQSVSAYRDAIQTARESAQYSFSHGTVATGCRRLPNPWGRQVQREHYLRAASFQFGGQRDDREQPKTGISRRGGHPGGRGAASLAHPQRARCMPSTNDSFREPRQRLRRPVRQPRFCSSNRPFDGRDRTDRLGWHPHGWWA